MPASCAAMLPVSTRAGIAGRELGNRVAAIFIYLPLDLPPVACRRRIWAQKSVARASHEGLGLAVALRAGGLLPAPLLAAGVRFLSARCFANLVISDIPGPTQPVLLLGARCSDATR
jgi:hypothetical protein